MRFKTAYAAIWGLLLCLSLSNFTQAQRSLSLDFTTSLPTGNNSSNIGNELNMSYQYRFHTENKDNMVYFFTSVHAFYQPEIWSGDVLFPVGSGSHNGTRYGTGLLLGAYSNNSLLNAELGIGFSYHISNSKNDDLLDNPNSGGFIFRPDDPLPVHYITFDFASTISFELINSVFLKGTFKIQTPPSSSIKGIYIRPGFGIGYNF